MPDEPEPLTPATADEIAQALAYALRFDGRRRVHHADDAMARITAERPASHLLRSRFVVSAATAARVAAHARRRADRLRPGKCGLRYNSCRSGT